MKRHQLILAHILCFTCAFATNQLSELLPKQPELDVKSFILIDANSNVVLAQKNATQEFEPASLTKLMSMYIVSTALKNQQINITDDITVSTKAWKQEGSRMFIKVGSKVSTEDLIKGVIVASGNDATMALAEHTAGSENSFVDIMNNVAKSFDLQHTHFMNPTGMPEKNHFSSARDLATIARHVIQDFPEHYEWYKQKWFTYNKIKQPNRNRLLWQDSFVDGMKTGHTNSAGYCLIASAKNNDTRLIAVIMGAKSDTARNNAASQLLNYGFRFYKTQKALSSHQALGQIMTLKGMKGQVTFGVEKDIYITYPKSANQSISTKFSLPKSIIAPIHKGEKIGSIDILINNAKIASTDIVSLEEISRGSNLRVLIDSVKSWFFG
jgi:D-alanyl-D-alanine carboxypeptidase (penicillin-binding protein 5/6)